MTSKSLQILFVQDSAPDTEHLIKTIEQQGTLVVSKRVDCAEQIKMALREHCFDVVISSDSLPKRLPQEAIQITRENDKDLPFVFVAKGTNELLHQELLNSGANDFVSSNELSRLAPAIAREIYYTNLQKKFRELEKRIIVTQRLADLGKFSGNIAHDFNNIMTVIMANCENMISETSEQDANYNSLKRIYKTAERGSKLVEQLLNYLRHDKNTSEAISLNDIFENLSVFLQQLVGKDIYIEIKRAPLLPKVFINVGQLEQVLINLCSNAKDAMPDGGSLTIETSQEEIPPNSKMTRIPPGNYCVLSFKDTGCGMAEEIQKNIFEPFFTTKPPPLGTGIGLTIVQEIVEANNGHITLTSEVNKGTTFKIFFPAL